MSHPLPFRKDGPPFHQGQAAFEAGEPITANPFDAAAPFKPDDYPGDHRNWLDGHNTARWRREFTDNHHDRMKHKEQDHA